MFQHHFKTDYKEKYLKYKNKYLRLKNQYGSSGSVSPGDSKDGYDYGDWEHTSDMDDAINKYFNEREFPSDDIGNALYLDPIKNKFMKIIDLIHYEDEVIENKIKAELNIENTRTALVKFLSDKAISGETSKIKYDQIKKEKELLKEQKIKAEADIIKKQQEEELRLIEQLEQERAQREEAARKLDEADKARIEMERVRAEAEAEKRDRVEQGYREAKDSSDQEMNSLEAECNSIRIPKACDTNEKCYYHRRDKRCKPNNDAKSEIIDNLKRLGIVKQYQRYQAIDERNTLLKNKPKIFNDCKKFNNNPNDCKGKKYKGRKQCFYYDSTGDCRPNKNTLVNIDKNLKRVENKLYQLDRDIPQEN